MPYVTTAKNRMAQVPVMIPPIGKIRMCVPGRTKAAPEATTRVWIGGSAADNVVTVVAAFAKTPVT